MREIKFRSWNPEVKKMYYDFDQNIKEVGLGKSIHSFVYDVGLAYRTLMEYTGLKDKNNKEIYEGDVVQWIFKRPGWIMNEEDYQDWKKDGSKPQVVKFEVKFEFNGWNCFDSEKGDKYHNKTCVVIGNIYENPELLK